jgi:DNA-binding NarL/FixJ family response regulator
VSPTAKASRRSSDDPLRGRTAIIIEDQKLFADFLAGCFRDWGLDVLLSTPSGAEGLAAMNKKQPNLLMLDFSLPDIDGLEIARQVLTDRTKSGMRVVGISSHRDPWTMLQVQKLGLHGFVDKMDQSAESLRAALVSVLSGNVFYTKAVTESSARLRQDPRAFNRVLSDYELKILGMIGRAMTDDEIAAALNISPATMQSRRRDIMKKLDIHTTPKLIHYTIVNGLTRPTRT